jgi:hypothetical protein
MSFVTETVNDLRPIRRPARILYAGAFFWLISAAVHIAALALDGWQWSGSVSFRKPVVFSVSIGVLLATVGWVLDRLPDRPRLAGVLAWTFLVSSSIEVGLIAMQTWRGRASHFNVLEAGDAAVFAAMGVSVGVMSLCLIGTLIWSSIERPPDPLVRFAVIGGLVLVATGLGIGQWIIGLGAEFVARNQEVPETVLYGSAGVAKFPHAVAFHGIQVFIISAVMLRKSALGESAQRRLMHLVFWSYAAILVFASAQTVAGRAPFDLSPWSVGLVASCAGVFLGLTWIIRSGRNPASVDRKTPTPVA